jgi:CheY-like chemotaxis protein
MLIPLTALCTSLFCLFISKSLAWTPNLPLAETDTLSYFELTKFYGTIFIPILAMAPLWICLELMFVGPAIRLSYVQKSFSTLTQYAIRSQTSTQSKTSLDVLLLEDDITSADPLLKLYKKIDLSCQHVSTIEEAEELFNQHNEHLKILMVDIFIRVVDPNFPRTGLDWLRELNQKYPKGNRDFIVIVYTGHQEILDKETLTMIDHVLPKPWNPREYLQYLAERGIFKVKKNA